MEPTNHINNSDISLATEHIQKHANHHPGFIPLSEQLSPPQSLSEQQLELLKAQILAFKLLSSSVPLPDSLLDALADDSMHKMHPEPTNLHSNQYIPPGSSIAFKLLYNMLHSTTQPTPSSIAMSSSSFPSVIPYPFEIQQLQQERDSIVNARIKSRIEQLESISISSISTEQLRLKALIELKSLKLFDIQKKTRSNVLSYLDRITTLTTLDTSGLRRLKKSSLRDSRLTERQERSLKYDKNKRDRQRRAELIYSILERVKEFQGFHKAYQQQKVNRLAKSVLHIHAYYEKEEMKRLDRIAKERIHALKADDEEAYLKLLDQQKDTRLTHLIRQTDLYLESLTSLVLAQKRDNVLFDKSSGTIEDSYEFDEPAPGQKVDYYHSTHKIGETINTQPRILIGGQLKEYQLKGLQWLVSLYNNRLNGILADEMGLGKTIQTIALISYLLESKNQNGPYLILVPLSTLTNWSIEFEKWAPSIVKIEYKGQPPVRKAIQAEVKMSKFNVMLTTYEYVIKDKAFLSKIKWLYLIIDEGHRMKNTQSKLAIVLSNSYSARYRLILTGTPLQNNLPELWSLLNFILPKIFDSGKTFEEWFNAPFANTGEKLELNEEETLLIIRRLHKVLRPFLLRRLKKDVESELPDKIERVIKCPKSALQAKLYDIIKEKSMRQHTTGIKRFNNTIMQLRKICNHPFVFEEVEKQLNPSQINNELLYRVSGKFELLKRILRKFHATGHRVLMFFQMTTVMTIMEDFLTMEGYRYLRLDGSTKSEDRAEMLKQFNASNSPYFIFLLSTRAGGLGLNLQTADTVIIFDSDWNPHQDLQAQDRAHRIGQTKEVRIYRLVTLDSVEEVILDRAQFKLSLDGKVIQAGKFDHKSTNEEREQMLRAILETEQGKDDDSENELLNDDELNELLARNDEESEIFQKIDLEQDRLMKQLATKQGKKWSRLIQESELPTVYLNDQSLNIEDEEAGYELGRGMRSKKAVLYDDGMSDDKWLRSLEYEEKKRNTSEDDYSFESDEHETKKSKRHDKNSKFKMDSLDPSERTVLQDKMQKLINIIEEEKDEYHQLRCIAFLNLPSKSLYPDYYITIERPISLKQIKSNIERNTYNHISEFYNDIEKMFENAMKYNVEESMIYLNAKHLREHVSKLIHNDNSSEYESEYSSKNTKVTIKLGNLKNG